MKSICPSDLQEWQKWLEKNHLTEDKITVIKYKKHTGRPILNNAEAMKVAICYGWIDTTVKRIDEERYSQNFAKRNKKSKWSINTLSYGKELFEKGLMSEFGIKMYKEGLLKKPHDFDIPKNLEIPKELKIKLEKDKIAKEKFEKMAPSVKKIWLRSLYRAKRPETKEKRIESLIKTLNNEK